MEQAGGGEAAGQVLVIEQETGTGSEVLEIGRARALGNAIQGAALEYYLFYSSLSLYS